MSPPSPASAAMKTIPPAASRRAATPALLTVSPALHADGQQMVRDMPVSATLAANEAMAARRRRGQPVLPLAFGEAGLPAHPALRDALAAAAASNSYGPVAGHPALRSAAAGYWDRRGLPTRPHAVVCGPGSKALLFGLLLAIGGDVAVPRPSWVSYAAQATMIGVRPHFVAAAPGEGGICDPDASPPRPRRPPPTAARSGRWWSHSPTTRPDGCQPRPPSGCSARWPQRTNSSSSATRSTATSCTTPRRRS